MTLATGAWIRRYPVLTTERAWDGTRRLLNSISRFGVAARAVIIVALGILLVRAALRHDAGEAEGVRGSMLELAGAGGQWALTFIALGLIAYAVDQALHARYRRIRSPIR